MIWGNISCLILLSVCVVFDYRGVLILRIVDLGMLRIVVGFYLYVVWMLMMFV